MVYTDKEKNDIAWSEYSKLNVGEDVLIGKGKKEKTIGYVSEIFGQPPEKDIGTIDSDLAGKFSNSVKEGVERKKLELNDLQEFCKTK